MVNPSMISTWPSFQIDQWVVVIDGSPFIKLMISPIWIKKELFWNAFQFKANTNTETVQQLLLSSDVCGQRCPDSIRVHCTVSVRQNLKFSVGRVFECPDFEFELDFDRQTPDRIRTESGQCCPPTSGLRFDWLFTVNRFSI